MRRSIRDHYSGVHHAAFILNDAFRGRLRRRHGSRLELVLAAGEAPGNDRNLTVAYAGPGDNRAWCLSTVFAAYTETARVAAKDPRELQRLLAGVRNDVDVIFADGLPADLLPESGPAFVSMPAWIKQRVRLLGHWPAQVDSLRRITRQEIGRILRKYQYRCSLSRQPDDHAYFYDRLYRPYVLQRFGPAAHVVARRTVLKECGRGVLLQLSRADGVLGAALLRPVGRTMAVVRSALDSARGPDGLRGVTDALDYFSLLYAHLQRCRWLDLGPSRPDLFDGTLRSRAKWGGEIYPGSTPQPKIYLGCNRSGSQFLQRHAFLIGVTGGFRAVLAVSGNGDADALGPKLRSIMSRGVQDYRVLSLTQPGARLKSVLHALGPDVTLADASACRDVMSAITE